LETLAEVLAPAAVRSRDQATRGAARPASSAGSRSPSIFVETRRGGIGTNAYSADRADWSNGAE